MARRQSIGRQLHAALRGELDPDAGVRARDEATGSGGPHSSNGVPVPR